MNHNGISMSLCQFGGISKIHLLNMRTCIFIKYSEIFSEYKDIYMLIFMYVNVIMFILQFIHIYLSILHCIHPFIQPLINLSTFSSIDLYLAIHPAIHPFILKSIHSFFYLSIYAFIFIFPLYMYIYLFIYSFQPCHILSFFHLYSPSLHLTMIHLFILSLGHLKPITLSSQQRKLFHKPSSPKLILVTIYQTLSIF